jgi:hypothetical protein
MLIYCKHIFYKKEKMMKIFLTFCMLSIFAIMIDAQSKDLHKSKSPENCIAKSAQAYNETDTNNNITKYDTLICAKYTHNTNNSTLDNKKKSFWKKVFSWDAETFNFWIVIVGAFQFLVLCVQGFLLGVTIRGEKTSKRPYVFITIDGPLQITPDQCDYKLILKNHGETAAIITSVNYACDFQIKNINDYSIPNGSIVLGPKESRTLTLSKPITSKDIDDVYRGIIKFFCYGRIGYKDIFSKKHMTIYCYEFDPIKGRERFFATKNKEWNRYT